MASRSWYKRNSKNVILNCKIRRSNPEVRARIRFQENLRTKNLSDSYIKNRLYQITGITGTLIPKSILEAKRIQLKLRRACYEQN